MSTLLQPPKTAPFPLGQVTHNNLPHTARGNAGASAHDTAETAISQRNNLPHTLPGQVGAVVHGAPAPFSAPPRGAENRHPGQTPIREKKKVTQKLEESTCNRCGQPTTTTRGLITQTWDLTPITTTQATWAALLRGPVLALTKSGATWRAQWDRNPIDIPSRHDTATHWLPIHQCWSPPLPGAGTPINLTPPGQAVEPDLFNQQPADELPPY